MLAQYLDDIPQIFARMVGKGRPKGPRGYGMYFTEKGALKDTVMARMAQREIAAGAGLTSGAMFGRPFKGLSQAHGHLKASFGAFGLATAIGIGALETYSAPRGHKMSAFGGGVARTFAFGIGDVVGTALGGPVAGWILGSLTEPMGAKVGEAIQMFNDFGFNVKHVNMGGNYQDTQVAFTMRQRAAQELGSSVMNARQYLGKEAALMHQ